MGGYFGSRISAAVRPTQQRQRRKLGFAAFAGLCVGVFGLHGTTLAAEPVTPSNEDAALRSALEPMLNERGQRCSVQAIRSRAASALVACGSAGLWELELREASGPRLLRSYDLGGEVLGFFEESDGRVWVKVQALQARPLSSITAGLAQRPQPGTAIGVLPPIPEPATTGEPAQRPSRRSGPSKERRVAPPSPGPNGRVVTIDSENVIISLGSAHQVHTGDHIDFSVEHRVRLAPGEVAISRESLAVGVVTNTSLTHATVRLGLNERVPLGASATPTDAPATKDRRGPPRLGGLWHAEFVARPFFALDELGGGFLLNAAAGYRFLRNLHLEAQLDPLAMGDAERKSGVTAYNLTLMVSYDSRLVELGVGVGAQSVNSVELDLEPGSGLGFAQFIRLGSLDGVNLDVRSNIVLFHSEFGFSALTVTGQLPVAEGYWLLAGGGGGSVGSAYGELGLRVLVEGRGDRGSTFFSASAGGAAVFTDGGCTQTEFGFSCGEGQSYAGPMVGIGLEHRF